MRSGKNKKIGFTLIELMVAVFVFSVVMVLSTGAIFSIISANKTSEALKSVLDNLNSALDSMSRDIRYGTVYHCGSNGITIPLTAPFSCPDDNTSDHSTFAFVAQNGSDTIIYDFKRDNPNDPTSPGAIYKCTNSTVDCLRLTAPEVHIQDLHFYVSNAMSDESGQPLLLISLSGYAQAGAASSTFNIETMVDERNLMCKDSMQNDLGLGDCP